MMNWRVFFFANSQIITSTQVQKNTSDNIHRPPLCRDARRWLSYFNDV